MIDVCITIHRNYDWLTLQDDNWRRIVGDYRLIVCDNTPPDLRRDIRLPGAEIFTLDVDGFDGVTHGAALDALVRRATSDIVCVMDSDFFWLRPDTLSKIQILFDRGCRCAGAEPWYDDWCRYVNDKYPEIAGPLAPCVFGMFVDRRLALEQTFVVTPQETCERFAYTGWRLRERLIKEKIPSVVFPGFRFPNRNASLAAGNPGLHEIAHEAVIHGAEDCPVGVHFVKGSGSKSHLSASALSFLDKLRLRA